MVSTYEEATRCPKCSNPGNVISKRLAPRGTTKDPRAEIHQVQCEHTLCPWFNTVWMVQVNSDGSIPPPTNHRGQNKIYQGFEDHDRIAQEIVGALEAQVVRETSGDVRDHEIRGR